MVINSQNLLPVIHFLLQSFKGSITFLRNPLTEDHIFRELCLWGALLISDIFYFVSFSPLSLLVFFSSNDFIIMNTTFYVYRGLLG